MADVFLGLDLTVAKYKRPVCLHDSSLELELVNIQTTNRLPSRNSHKGTSLSAAIPAYASQVYNALTPKRSVSKSSLYY